MSDLLDSVRAVNPVLSCEQPSMEGVWRKLAQNETDPSTRRRTTRWRGSIALSAVAAAVTAAVVLLVASGQRAAVLTGSPQLAQASATVRRLASGTISCDFTSAGGNGGPAVASVSARGRSAIVFCRHRYLSMERASDQAHGVTFIACQTSATNVAVYISDGRPNECGRHGDRALPAGYAAAVRSAGSHTPAISKSEDAGALPV